MGHSHRPLALAAVLLTILVAASAQKQKCPISPEFLTKEPKQQAELLQRCKGLHGVKISVPWDCQQYVVCCSGNPLTFSCKAPWEEGLPYYSVSARREFGSMLMTTMTA